MKTRIIAAIALAAAIGSLDPWVQPGRASVVLAQASPMVDGEVRRIDLEQGKVTLRHGPIPNLDMGAMSMVFRVKDPTMLARMRLGQKIRFEAAKVDGELTVTRFEPSP